MRTGIFLALMLVILNLTSVAQQLPACIAKLNRESDLTTTKFERIIQLKGNRTVYQFSVKSVPRCMDCHNGTIFYDGNCNAIASFMMGRGASAYVDYGYTAEELGKAGYPNIKYRAKKEPVSSCMEKVLSNTDSLNRAGVSKVVQVRMKGKILYGFEHRLAAKLANCRDCPRTIVYYNEDCKRETTFLVGGIAGVQAQDDYTITDYSLKTTLRIVWNSNETQATLPKEIKDEPKVTPLSKMYTVGKNLLPDFEVFKPGDKISVSSRDGLKHFRNGKQLNTYKIIPLQLTEHTSMPAKPSVILSKQHQVFYLEPFKRYFIIVDNSFLVTKGKYLRTNALTNFNRADWASAFVIK